ncbi:MAG: sugar ABC transporter substrate-binding protein [Spirochaetales bacterium]|nr:sugar ABC transporter substrate-binding protein [Spirochaetales bacterium]
MIKKIHIFIFILIILKTINIFANGKQDVITFSRWASLQEAENSRLLVKEFMKRYPNIKVNTNFLPWSDYWQKVKDSIQGNNTTDVFLLSQTIATPYIVNGYFKNLKEIEGTLERFNDMQSITKSAVIYNNGIYAMPVGIGVRALVYNKTLFDEVDIKYPDNTQPWTWKEFKEKTKNLTTYKDSEVIQYAAHFYKLEIWEALVNQMGGRLTDDNSNPTKIFINTPEGIEGLQLLIDLINENIIPPFIDAESEWNGPWGSPDTAVATGKVAIMQTGPWGLDTVEDAGIDYGTAPLPMGKTRCNRGYINSLAISKNSKKPDAAWTFIKWLTSIEGQIKSTNLSGELPANKDALEECKKNSKYPIEIMNAYYSELPYVITGPMYPDEKFNDILNNILSRCFRQDILSEMAALQIEIQCTELIKQDKANK